MTVDDLQAFEKSANRYLYGTLAGALAGGGIGALTSSRGKERPGESEEERRNRIIRNALGMAVAGAGAGAAIPGVYHLLNNSAEERTRLQKIVREASREQSATVGAALGAGAGYRSPVSIDNKLRAIEDALVDNQHKTMGFINEAARRKIDKQVDLHRKELLGGVTNLKRMGARAGIGAVLGFAAPKISDIVSKSPGYTAAAGTGAGALLTPGGAKRKLLGAGVGGLAGLLFGSANEKTRSPE